jgi:hypothetical protein
MRFRARRLIIGAVCLFWSFSLYGVGCERDPVVPPTITAPAQGSTIAPTGTFTASVTFPSVLTAASFVQMELRSGAGSTTIDVTSEFLPGGQTDFAGATSASATLDAVALNLVPGPQTFLVRLDVTGFGGRVTQLVTFNWLLADPCDDAAGAALGQCFVAASDATQQCYIDTRSACSPTDPALVAAESALRSTVTSACDDGSPGGAAAADARADQLMEQCLGNPATLAARVFGGPHARSLGGTTSGDALETCLDSAYAESADFLDLAFNLQRACVLDGAACATLDADLATAEAQHIAAVDAACGGGGLLYFLAGSTSAQTLGRVKEQSDCMLATAHRNTAPLELGCGPRAVVTAPPRGVPTQVILDSAEWGSLCGDGSDFAFYLRLAPDGQPIENLIVQLQGGGVCLFEGDCTSRFNDFPGLFDAQGDSFPDSGYLNTDDTVNPFGNWSMVFLPYCTQDIFTGGGLTETFAGGLDVERYGALNVREALRYARDAIWATLRSEGQEYRPEQMKVIFAGSSAGGYGAQYNAHYPLDELRWINTTIVPDSSLALNGGGQSLPGLVQLKEEVWNTRPFLPPYCFSTDCILGEVIFPRHSERLGATPLQQLLNISPQWDSTQSGTTYFTSDAAWTNSARQTYCDLRGTPNVHYFMPANLAPQHTYLEVETLFQTQTAAGVNLRDWLAGAIADPASVSDAVEEGTLATQEADVDPFPCAVDP